MYNLCGNQIEKTALGNEREEIWIAPVQETVALANKLELGVKRTLERVPSFLLLLHLLAGPVTWLSLTLPAGSASNGDSGATIQLGLKVDSTYRL